MVLHQIIDVIPLEDFRLEITFDDGEVRVFDLKPYLSGSLFTPLQNIELFKKVKIGEEIRGLTWPNGADLCADMLYMNSQPYDRSREKATTSSSQSAHVI